jgi:hypothetical protein
MLTLSESDQPKAEKLERLRSFYTPCVNQWRDNSIQFLSDELPGARVADVYDYDFGFGAGTTTWNIALLNGTVMQLIAASNNIETLVSRSSVPRTHDPATPFSGARIKKKPLCL